jgi:hypothetical protein
MELLIAEDVPFGSYGAVWVVLVSCTCGQRTELKSFEVINKMGKDASMVELRAVSKCSGCGSSAVTLGAYRGRVLF